MNSENCCRITHWKKKPTLLQHRQFHTEHAVVSDASSHTSENSALAFKLLCSVEQFKDISAAITLFGNAEHKRAAWRQVLHAWSFLGWSKPDMFCCSGICQAHQDVKLEYRSRLQNKLSFKIQMKSQWQQTCNSFTSQTRVKYIEAQKQLWTWSHLWVLRNGSRPSVCIGNKMFDRHVS